MPGLYAESTFDLAGTIIGVVEADAALHGEAIAPGDVLLGYGSTGLHTNGYTLARHVFLDRMGLALDAPLPGGEGTVIDALLAVHRSYVDAIRPVLGQVHGLAHITGGGIAGNLVRVLPEGVEAVIDPRSWEWPVLFQAIAEGGGISRDEMREVFNLGAGMIAAVAASDVDAVRATATAAGVPTWVMGDVRSGTRRVRFAD
jgi:phosphoribosylformylglycinamidine cyclo-ligase